MSGLLGAREPRLCPAPGADATRGLHPGGDKSGLHETDRLFHPEGTGKGRDGRAERAPWGPPRPRGGDLAIRKADIT